MSITQSLSNKQRLDHNFKGVGISEMTFQEEWLSRQIILNMSAEIFEQQVHHQQTKAKGGWCRDSLPNTIHWSSFVHFEKKTERNVQTTLWDYHQGLLSNVQNEKKTIFL